MFSKVPFPEVDAGTADIDDEEAVAAAAIPMISKVAAERESTDTVSRDPRFFFRTRRFSNLWDAAAVVGAVIPISTTSNFLLNASSRVDGSGWRPPPPGRRPGDKFLANES